MTLHRFREIIDELDDDKNEKYGSDYTVYVALAPDGMVGGTAVTPVVSIRFGFD